MLRSLFWRTLMAGSFMIAAAAAGQVTVQSLDTGWAFSPAGEGAWLEAEVPGCVHTDLLRHGLIPDPHFRLNEKYVQWVGEKDWSYRTRFTADAALLDRERIELVFEGLDTYATVRLNGKQVLSADNMFRTWRVEVKKQLQPGLNTLEIDFRSVFAENLPKYAAAPFRLEAFPNNDQADVKINMYSRKAGFHFGWDWGPRLITCGIWRPARLEAWDTVRLEDLQIHQNDLTDREARLTAQFTLEAQQAQNAELTVWYAGKRLGRRQAALVPGCQRVDLEFRIAKPRRWWTNGLGEPFLYTLTGRVTPSGAASGRGAAAVDAAAAPAGEGSAKPALATAAAAAPASAVQEKSLRIGLRTLRVVREKDQHGRSFYVELNGVPVFMKGANYIPQDNFQNRVTRARYEHILGSARDAHMNMLRIWGGGIWEEDLLYDLCDEYGLLVWQDMMFACGMYPGDPAYLDNVRAEVSDNVRRLRNHPCIALWCGNNENQIAWYAWGWRESHTEAARAAYERDMHHLYDELLPQTIAGIDPGRYYHPSSPVTGYNKISYMEGDAHYWGVWHGRDPFRDYHKNIARFVSEYGFQSYPELATVESFTLPEDRQLQSAVMLSHQRCMADERRDKEYGNRLIQHYMESDYRLPDDFSSYLYLSQVLQAEGVKLAIQAHRGAMPICMGSLYWQIDDCWPVASWSSIDYHGRWKALHYFARDAFRTFMIIPKEGEGRLDLRIVSDSLRQIPTVLELKVMDFQGVPGYSARVPLQINANSSAVYHSLALEELLGKFSRRSCLLQLRLQHEGRTLADELFYFTPVKELELPRPEIQAQVSVAPGGCSITLTSGQLAKNLLLESADRDGFWSDNYFDLLPGETRTVFCRTRLTPEELQAGLRLRSVRDSW